MNDAFANFLEIPGKWTALVFAASLLWLIGWSLYDGRKLKELIGYVGAFGIGFAIIEAFLKRDGAEPLINCSTVSEVVVTCNGWTSYNQPISDLMFQLSAWYRSSFGSSDQYLFSLGVVMIVFHMEIGKNPLGTGRDVLRAFLITAGLLFIFNYSALLVSNVNGLVDSAFSLSYANQAAAAKNAAFLIDDLDRIDKAIEAKDFLATAVDTATGLGYGGWKTQFYMWVTGVALGLASFVNMGLFLLQSIILYALPAITLVSILIGNFALKRVFSYIAFSALLRIAAMLQLLVFSGFEKTTNGGLALLDNSIAIMGTALIAAVVGVVFGTKIIMLLLVREAFPMISGTPFQIGRR